MYQSEVLGNGGIGAKVLKASKFNDKTLWTLEIKAPKFIDAEFEKHRMLSSNSSSSRAIPFKNLEDYYLPFDLRANQSGMQGYEKVADAIAEDFIWYMNMVRMNTEDVLNAYKDRVHKQHLNRYIEPWMYQTKVVTATEWDNFFKLRLAADVQPEMHELAKCMKLAMDIVTPYEVKLNEDYFHVPYVTDDLDFSNPTEVVYALKCSVARCARVSFTNRNRNTQKTIQDDFDLFDRLLSSGHMTPFEHQAKPMDIPYSDTFWKQEGATHIDVNGGVWSANFNGWAQYRKLVEAGLYLND